MILRIVNLVMVCPLVLDQRKEGLLHFNGEENIVLIMTKQNRKLIIHRRAGLNTYKNKQKQEKNCWNKPPIECFCDL